jgi:hypothetical protein
MLKPQSTGGWLLAFRLKVSQKQEARSQEQKI